MEREPPNRRPTSLKLNEQQKRNVRALQRQISRQSTSNFIDGGDNDDIVAELTKDELQLLEDVVDSFKSYNSASVEASGDEVDGVYTSKKIWKGGSVESYDAVTPEGDNFLNPARFYVHLTKEDVEALENVCIEMGEEEAFEKANKIAHHKGSHGSYSLLNGYGNKGPSYGLSVALTQQCEKIVVVKNTSTSAEPESFSNPKQDSFHLISNRRVSQNNQNNGFRSKLKHLPPKERFRQAVYLVINNPVKSPPRKMDEDFPEFWRKRGNVTWLSLAFTIGGIAAFFADTGTDLKVAIDHFTTGQDYWWGGFTLTLVFLPSVVTNVVSYFWYKEDSKRLKRPPEGGWKEVCWTHWFLVGVLQRYWRVLVKAYRIKRKKDTSFIHNKLLIAMELDSALLQMILAFTEDVPQLVLQMYILISRHIEKPLDTSGIQDLWTLISICLSFFSYSRAVVNYIKCLRDSKRHKGQLRWYGYLSMWLWRALMIMSRLLTLVFFATEFKLWFFVALGIHFIIVLCFLERHEVYFFPGNEFMQQFFRVVMSYIHLFCFFCLEGSRTYSWAVKYYILEFIEIVVFSILWFTNKTRFLPWQLEVAGFVVIYMFFAFGLLMMSMYYKFLHPRFNRPRFRLSVPKKSELADEDFGDNLSREKFELWI